MLVEAGGGMPLRATYVHRVSASLSDVLLADAGGTFETNCSGPFARSSNTCCAAKPEIEAAALTSARPNRSAAPGNELRRLADKTQAPFVSTNLHDSQSRNIATTHRIVERGATRVAILGVLSPKFAAAGQIIDDPAESVLRLVPTLKGQYDVLLVLAYLPEDELEALAARVPEADLVVGGPTRQSIAPRRTGPTVWGATTNKGKFLVHLERPVKGAPWDGKIVELGTEFEDDANQLANLKAFREELARSDFSAAQTGFSPSLSANPPAGFQVVGTPACQACHADDCESWKTSRHGHAWQTLLDDKTPMSIRIVSIATPPVTDCLEDSLRCGLVVPTGWTSAAKTATARRRRTLANHRSRHSTTHATAASLATTTKTVPSSTTNRSGR